MALIDLANINNSGGTPTPSSEYSDIDGIKYTNSVITKFPDNWRFAPRTGNTCAGMFSSCRELTSLDLSSFDASKVTNMASMFNSCRELTSLDLSSFDTSSVTNMESMFYSCQKLTSLDLSSFDTSNVTSMACMFYNCLGLTSLDLSSFDTSKVTNMTSMFNNCQKLTSLVLSSFVTSKVNMANMFYNCSKLTSLDLSSLDTSNVTDMRYAFYNCTSLVTIVKGSFTQLKVSLDLSSCKNLSKQSVIDLFDSIGTANTGATITLASAVGSQLTDEEKKVATDKGWALAEK